MVTRNLWALSKTEIGYEAKFQKLYRLLENY